MRIQLQEVCVKASSNIAQKDLENHIGEYPIYGASGFIKTVDFYKHEKPYVAVVKDGAGVGRTMLLPEKSSVIGTMQALIPNEKIAPELLKYVVQNMHLENSYTGATIPHIYFKDYCKKEFDLPDKKQQVQIITILSTIEEIIENYHKELKLLDLLIKSRFVEIFGDPVYNEKGWPTKALLDVCESIVDPTKALLDVCESIVDCPHSTPLYTQDDTGYMCIRTSIVKKNRIEWDKIEYISKEEYLQRIQRKKPQKGDVIYTKEGAILGIAAVIDQDCNVALGQRSMLLSPNEKYCASTFLSVAMNFDSFLDKALKGMSGSASPHINVGDIKAFKMIMPPVCQQKLFSDFVEQINKSKLAQVMYRL